MTKQKNNIQLLHKAVSRRMGQLNHLGESKKTARELYNSQLQARARINNTKSPLWKPSPYIHGFETLQQYTEICKAYAVWLVENHPQVSKLTYAHKHGYDREYIQQQIDDGKSAWTINRFCAALAKLHGCSMQEIHNSRPTRKRSAIKRGRGYSETQFAQDVNHYGELAELCRYIGVRRCELSTLTPSCFFYTVKDDLILLLSGGGNNTKGGKNRTVVILKENQAAVKRIINNFPPNEIMFPNVPKRLNVHAIRALYANDYYKAIATDLQKLKGQYTKDHKGRTVPSIYHCRDGHNKPCRMYDRNALAQVSLSLGHNRADVVATHYLF